MRVTKILPPTKYSLIIAGPHDAFVAAFRERLPTYSAPPANVKKNGYGAFHTDVWLDDPAPLRDWFAATHDRGPGSLLFFNPGLG